jgi:hypothetical protein
MNQQEQILKVKLTKVKNNNYILEEHEDYFLLAKDMMDNIGSLDSELRDELINSIFFHWISEGKFTHDQLNQLLNACLDSSHLFYKLQDKDEDAVFKRTFSALVIAVIIYTHRKDNFLSNKALYTVKDKVVEYMFKEKDVRGYDNVKGWAHSAAHTADALDELALCDCFNKADLVDILNSIKAKVCIGYYVYVDEESERMVNAVESCFNRKLLSNSEILEWLQEFKVPKAENWNFDNYHLKINVKGFLRSLYFRFLDNSDSTFITDEIKVLLSNL